MMLLTINHEAKKKIKPITTLINIFFAWVTLSSDPPEVRKIAPAKTIRSPATGGASLKAIKAKMFTTSEKKAQRSHPLSPHTGTIRQLVVNLVITSLHSAVWAFAKEGYKNNENPMITNNGNIIIIFFFIKVCLMNFNFIS